MTFGQRVKKIKEKFRLSEDELAVICGVSTTSLANYYNNTSEPELSVVVRLSEKFSEIHPLWLLTGQGEMLKNGIGITTVSDKNSYKNIGSTKSIVAEKEMQTFNGFKL